MKRTSPLISVILCLLILLVLPSCLWHSWGSVKRCYNNAQAGETTVWQVKRRCGNPDMIMRAKNNVVYYYAQYVYDSDWLKNHDSYELIEFKFSLDGKLVSTDMNRISYPLPWACFTDPFDGGNLNDLLDIGANGSYLHLKINKKE